MQTTISVRSAYYGSDGQVTVALMDKLLACGDDGVLAVLLFKAQKASTRAKKYRGGDGRKSYRSMAYDRKNKTLMDLAAFLDETGGESWGWGRDWKTPGFSWVLYVDLPTGQCSFHSATRGPGRDYDGRWEPRKASELVVIEYCELVMQ